MEIIFYSVFGAILTFFFFFIRQGPKYIGLVYKKTGLNYFIWLILAILLFPVLGIAYHGLLPYKIDSTIISPLTAFIISLALFIICFLWFFNKYYENTGGIKNAFTKTKKDIEIEMQSAINNNNMSKIQQLLENYGDQYRELVKMVLFKSKPFLLIEFRNPEYFWHLDKDDKTEAFNAVLRGIMEGDHECIALSRAILKRFYWDDGFYIRLNDAEVTDDLLSVLYLQDHKIKDINNLYHIDFQSALNNAYDNAICTEKIYGTCSFSQNTRDGSEIIRCLWILWYFTRAIYQDCSALGSVLSRHQLSMIQNHTYLKSLASDIVFLISAIGIHYENINESNVPEEMAHTILSALRIIVQNGAKYFYVSRSGVMPYSRLKYPSKSSGFLNEVRTLIAQTFDPKSEIHRISNQLHGPII